MKIKLANPWFVNGVEDETLVKNDSLRKANRRKLLNSTRGAKRQPIDYEKLFTRTISNIAIISDIQEHNRSLEEKISELLSKQKKGVENVQ